MYSRENKIDEDKIKDLVGIPKFDFVNNIIQAIFEYNVDDVIKNTNDVLNQGKDLDNFLWEMIKYVKDILVFQSYLFNYWRYIYSKDSNSFRFLNSNMQDLG